jgi:hypothetical protein
MSKVKVSPYKTVLGGCKVREILEDVLVKCLSIAVWYRNSVYN